MKPIHASLQIRMLTLSLMAFVMGGCSHTISIDTSGNSPEKSITSRPIVIAHRGASGYRPEHTLAGYELAIDLGADFIEPDLVSTQDGVLIARHENNIAETTNVSKIFPKRKTRKTIDGVSVEGWFTEDFTLKEIKTLRARERLPIRDASFNDRFEIPTFNEILDLVARKSKEKNRVIGVYPELKHPTYFKTAKLDLVPPFIKILRERGLTHRDSPIFIQCFEPGTLQLLRNQISARLIQLIESEGQPYDFTVSKDPRQFTDLVTPSGLDFVKTYADGIGPDKKLLISRTAQDNLGKPTPVIHEAHLRGLLVHPWTFRKEAQFLPRALPQEPLTEFRKYFEAGIDGLFTDFTDLGVQARSAALQE